MEPANDFDVPESFSSSIFTFWEEAYHSTSLTELIRKVEGKTLEQESDEDFVEGYPNPCFFFYSSLEREMQMYETDLSKFLNSERKQHFNIIHRIQFLCEEYHLFLKNMTLVKYKQIVDKALSMEQINNGRVLVVWYFTTLLIKINEKGYGMREYLCEKLKYLENIK